MLDYALKVLIQRYLCTYMYSYIAVSVKGRIYIHAASYQCTVSRNYRIHGTLTVIFIWWFGDFYFIAKFDIHQH